MATIDLGKIKQVFRGTYNNATAYAVDDLVAFTDGTVTSTYICTTASTGNNPSSGGTAHANWAYVAKGQATSPTTTQGDIIVRGASADARLAIGTAGQVLKVNSGANGLEYGTDVGGKILQVVATNISATSSLAIPSGSTGTTTSPVNVTITSTVLNSKFLISGMVNGEASNMPDIWFGHVLKRTIGGSVSLVNVGTSGGNRSVITRVQNIGHHDDNRTNTPSSNAFAPFLDSPNQAAGTAIKYAFELRSTGSTGTFYYGRGVTDNDGDESERMPNNITVMEVSP